MSADLQTRPLSGGADPLATRPRLSRRVLWGSLVWSGLLGTLGALLLGRGPVVAVLLSVLALAVSLPALSARIEGSRRAKDRFVTIVVSVAFSLAMLPLVSLLMTVH
ncbi:MAG: phosphate ABC transporter, permease protein PstA, partial [Nocardioides sp.]